MKSVSYNNQRVDDITSSEYEALCLLLPYWGMQLFENKEEISGALSTFMLGIHGLSQQKVKELSQLLQHTGITLTTDHDEKCSQRFFVDFHENHPMPLAVKTPDRQLYYLNPATRIQFPVQSAIHKGITLKRKDGPLFLAVQPAFEKQIAEWISYIVIQSFLRFSFESLTSISETTFISCVEKVLYQVNDSFAANQLPDDFKTPKKVNPKKIKEVMPEKSIPVPEFVPSKEFTNKMQQTPDLVKPSGQKVSVPQIRPFSANGSLITSSSPKPFSSDMLHYQISEPIKPFNSTTAKKNTIQPFHSRNTLDANPKSIIRPFQSKQNTPSSNQEYNKNTSNIFRKRRDGK
ncbi:hypothetical protein [Bacillus sp. NEB1478]|uniref:hypothetical protein n=1 Tax=Bacillus sp. NEB1478 TaxID=3073816 RepID=UPI002872B0DD|nr:hypothetical protein [Bacillus sp. NEB1478]WNB90579.1 hypothetical protein RGB74_11695 [Bacillus sp. NEB1478]